MSLDIAAGSVATTASAGCAAPVAAAVQAARVVAPAVPSTPA
jgi:hypothetical protein